MLLSLLLGKAYRFHSKIHFPPTTAKLSSVKDPSRKLICFSEIKEAILSGKVLRVANKRRKSAVARRHAQSLRPVSLFGIHGGRSQPQGLNLRGERKDSGDHTSRAEQCKATQPEETSRPKSQKRDPLPHPPTWLWPKTRRINSGCGG